MGLYEQMGTKVRRGALTEADRGRGVVYSHRHGAEDGVITSWNDSYVFVRFRGSESSKACRDEDLNWLLPKAM